MSSGTNDGLVAPEAYEQLPRFLKATVAVEQWLTARAEDVDDKSPDERAQWFHDRIGESNVLSTAAQLLDFVLSVPQLGPEVTNGATKRLAQAIAESEAPADIVAIYSDLYPEAAPAVQEDSPA